MIFFSRVSVWCSPVVGVWRESHFTSRGNPWWWHEYYQEHLQLDLPRNHGKCMHIQSSTPGGCYIYDAELVLKANLANFRSPITSISVVKSFCKFSQSTAVILRCCGQKCKTSLLLSYKLWAPISGDLSLICVLDGHPVLQQPQKS